jgi:hypothetical protein
MMVLTGRAVPGQAIIAECRAAGSAAFTPSFFQAGDRSHLRNRDRAPRMNFRNACVVLSNPTRKSHSGHNLSLYGANS